MSKYNEGDLVEAVKGETVIRGRLDFKLELELTLALRSDVVHLRANGYTVRTVEKGIPKVVLPKAIFQFTGGPIAVWKEDILAWLITGDDNAWGDPKGLMRVFGSEFTILGPVNE